jgi:hypothetical protein
VCVAHGGAARQVRLAAERRVALDAAMGELKNLGVPLGVHPIEALSNLVAEANGSVAFLRNRVQELGDEILVRGPYGEMRPNVFLELYGQWSERLARFVKLSIDVGLDERRVRIEEQQAEVIAEVFNLMLADLGLADDPRARASLARHLRAVAAVAEGQPPLGLLPGPTAS